MNPLSIRAHGYRTFDRLELNLPSGCVAVLGANGAGKSTILNAVDLGLFGPDGRSWEPYLTAGGDATDLMIELTFEHGGETYRVRRGYSARGQGKSTLDLEVWPNAAYKISDWEPLTLGTARETQAQLEQIIGFTRATLRASSLLLQGQGGAFTESDPRDRKRILADALGLDRFETYLAAARADRRAADQEITKIDGRLEGADDLKTHRDEHVFSLRALSGELSKVAADLYEAETAHEAAEQTWQAAQAQAAERRVAETRRDAAEAAYYAREKLRDDALAAATAVAEIKGQLDGLPTREQLDALQAQEEALVLAVEQHREAVRVREEAVRLAELRAAEYDAMVAQADAAQRKATELDEKVAHLKRGTLDTCPTCQQELGSVARQDTIASLRAQAQQHEEEAQALLERADAIEAVVVPAEPDLAHVIADTDVAEALNAVRLQLRDAREAEVQRATLLERLNGHSRMIMEASSPEYLADLERLGEARQAAEDALAALPEAPAENSPESVRLQRAVGDTRMYVVTLRERLEQVRRDHAVQTERLAQLDARIAQHAADLAEKEALNARIDVLSTLERAFGPDGIPALILEASAIPQIEAEANAILARLPISDQTYRVELRTQRALKTGALSDSLDVVIVTDEGEREYGTFSGGEKTRINIALRLALAQLLATRRGAECKIVAVDEPDGLDAVGKETLVEILRELEAKGIERIYLVSHDVELRDSFDSTLHVVKENGRSRVGGSEVEAVVA